jgi:hypothetical protein
MARQTRSKKPKSGPPKHMVQSYREAPDLRSVFADGNLLRLSGDGQFAILTFYQDDKLLRSQEHELYEASEHVATYKPGKLKEDDVRTIHATVKLPTDKALAMAITVLDRVKHARPELMQNIENPTDEQTDD